MKSELQQYVEKEIKKYEGVYLPVKAGLLRRALIRTARVSSLHPNPEDEFCSPTIGPSISIVSKYAHQIADAARRHDKYGFPEPIVVEKVRPDGYLILNGHHRWAAALQQHRRRVAIRIADLTQEADLRAMLRKAAHDRRVVFDLDEVVFCRDDSEAAEKPLPFPLRRIYPERVRLGIPALFAFFRYKGYDVWVYSANLYSMDYIRNLFRHYRTRLTGIVTGTGRKVSSDVREREKLEKELRSTYAVTLHADRGSLLRVDDRVGSFEEFEIGADKNWSAEIMEIVREIAEHEKQQADSGRDSGLL